MCVEVTEVEKTPCAQLDEAWKEVLKKYFKDFVELCWYKIFDKIDWSQGYEFLEQEFYAISKKEEIGKRIIDKLIKIYLKDGQEVWALIHIETQSEKEKNFSERMYIYRYRIYDFYQKDIATLVILIDNNKSWRPNTYEKEFWGTKLTLEYPILKILDFYPRRKELEESRNPFALVILAQLAALETKNSQKSRMLSKYDLTKWLYSHKWEKANVINLLRFLEEVLVLNKSYTLEYINQVKQLEQEMKVSYTTTTEKMWLQQGICQGIQHGEAHLLTNLLRVKFKNIPQEYINRINNADANSLEQWGINFVFATSLDEVFKQ